MSSTFEESETSQLPSTILQHFDLVSIPYDATFRSRIDTRRQTYPGSQLFFDRLLDVGGIDGSLYPPSSPATFRRLLQSIYSAGLERSRQDCFFYYLLRDCDLAFPALPQVNGGMELELAGQHTDIPSRAADFASSRRLSSPWVAFMDAYWSLDNEDWDIAVEHLCNPIISDLNFFPEILNVLATHVSPPSHSLSLVRDLLLYTGRSTDYPRENDLKLISLASTASLSEAFDFIRTFDDEERKKMREELWYWMLGAPTIPAGAGGHAPQGKVIKQLVHLPLEQEELDHLLDFLARPPRTIPPAALSLLHDLVTLRLVHQGQYAESIQLDKDSAGSAGRDVDRQRRREMVREFISILPDVQKRALAIEGDERTGKQAEERESAPRPNGFAARDTSTMEVDGHAPVNGSLAAPTPLRPVASASNLGHGAPPCSPAPGSQNRSQSPFTGPPRFASGQQSSPGLRQRVMSGPFALPRVASQTGSPAPRRPRQIIDDESPTDHARPKAQNRQPTESGSTPVARRTRQASVVSEAEYHEPTATGEAESSSQAVQPVRRSKRVVSSSSQAPKSPPRPASPPPASPPSRRTRTRQASQDPTTTSMPGSFNPQTVEPVPEDEVLPIAPPTPARSNIGNGRPNTSARSRMTRSVSRAALDDDDGHQDGTPKKKQRTKRTIHAEEEATPGPKRTTRASTRASSVMPSEAGSPTPSMASIARSETGRRKTVARGGSAQPTPRQTRAKRN